MKNQSKKTNPVLIVILYILSIVFFAYGIYMVIYSMDYVQSYQSNSSVATENAIQYVVTSSIAYFGFGILILIGAVVLGKLNKLQTKIYKAISSAGSYNDGETASVNDGEQLILPIDDVDNQKNPYYVEPESQVINEPEVNVHEPVAKSKKELKAEKKEAKLREKQERAAYEAA